MPIEQLVPFLAVIALAAYIQTVVGFGMGMIVLGLAVQFSLTSITFASVVISVVMLANGPIAIKGHLNEIDKAAVVQTLIGLFPALLLGVLLLHYLSSDFTRILQMTLAVTIICGGLFIALKPEPLTERSGNTSFLIAGGVAGIFGGLFAISGPPLVYQFYRQPMSVKSIRICLLLILLIMDLGRLVFMGIQGSLDQEMLWVSLVCLPVVAVFTLLGNRFPLPFSDKTMRRVAFIMLIMVGFSLLFSA